MDASESRQQQEQEPCSESESSEGRRLSIGAVQALQEEIAALRNVLSPTTRVAGCAGRPAISKVLPGYEEARWGELSFSLEFLCVRVEG